LQHFAQGTGNFSSGDHIYIKIAENLAVLRESLRKALASFDLILQVDDYGFEFLILNLLGYRLKGILKAYTGSNHNSKLICKVQNVFISWAGLYPESLYHLKGGLLGGPEHALVSGVLRQYLSPLGIVRDYGCRAIGSHT
jgi:hypothetical protein